MYVQITKLMHASLTFMFTNTQIVTITPMGWDGTVRMGWDGWD